MTIKDHSKGKIITLSKAFDTRPKLLNLFYFTAFFFTGLTILKKIATESRGDNTLSTVLLMIFPLVLFVAAYRFANKAVQTEKLIVSREQLTLVRAGLFSSKKNTYDISHIENFRHLAKPQITKHPLAGESFDYNGFQTGQHLANELHGDNRIAFDYKGSTIKFGENIYSWDFNQLEVALYDITGNDLRYTDSYEKTFFENADDQ